MTARRRRWQQMLGVSVVLAALIVACTPKVLVTIPPKIDLQPYETIGILTFTSAGEHAALADFATQKFMSVVQASQPHVRFLELAAAPVFGGVEPRRLDAEAVKRLGAHYNVATIFTGVYEISSLRPQISFGQDLGSVKAGVTVTMSLALRHWDARTGAIIWTNSRQGRWPVANVRKGAGGPVSVSMSDPTERYPRFMEELVYAVADDFREHHEWRPAPKE